MNRRQVLMGCASLLAFGQFQNISAAEILDFSEEDLETAKASGKPFMLGFHTDW